MIKTGAFIVNRRRVVVGRVGKTRCCLDKSEY